MELKDNSRWIEFGNKLLRLSDINFFSVQPLTITCHYQLGMKFEEEVENFKDDVQWVKRYYELKEDLNMKVAPLSTPLTPWEIDHDAQSRQ